MSSYVRDVVAFVSALGYKEVACVVGHDFGSPLAACCALVRPDLFGKLVMMSAPFPGPPPLPFKTPISDIPSSLKPVEQPPRVHEQLDRMFASMSPPRMHYQHYFASSKAAKDMDLPVPQLTQFLRDYFHTKSADWLEASKPEMLPRPLQGFTPTEAEKLPVYYIMPRGEDMPSVVQGSSHDEFTSAGGKACKWMTDEDIAVYAKEYYRQGFQGGLNMYRCATGDINIPLGGSENTNDEPHKDYVSDFALFSGSKITVPALFIAGALDWGPYQIPGSMQKMQEVCTDFKGVIFVPGAGHWVQQEKSMEVASHLRNFIDGGL